MIDAYHREWDINENDLDTIIRSHRLQLIIEYRTTNETSPSGSKVKFFLEVKDEMNNVLIDYNNFYPLSDSNILLMVRSYLRENKINRLLNDTINGI